VRREEDVRNLVDQTVARFGRLDVAVNDAGTEGQPGPLTPGGDRPDDRVSGFRQGRLPDRSNRRSQWRQDCLVTPAASAASAE
jgi:NAD(P)-dependent dehydrogenase (short-subunit alcohol dehydrogenase family)